LRCQGVPSRGIAPSVPRRSDSVGVLMRRVMRQTSPDPLAVNTFTQAGEEIAFGEPSVTHEDRAAAGRQTVAEAA
jgi:hypothetical protein